MVVCDALPAATCSVDDTGYQCEMSATTNPVSVTEEAEVDAVGVKVKLTLLLEDASVCP